MADSNGVDNVVSADSAFHFVNNVLFCEKTAVDELEASKILLSVNETIYEMCFMQNTLSNKLAIAFSHQVLSPHNKPRHCLCTAENNLLAI